MVLFWMEKAGLPQAVLRYDTVNAYLLDENYATMADESYASRVCTSVTIQATSLLAGYVFRVLYYSTWLLKYIISIQFNT